LPDRRRVIVGHRRPQHRDRLLDGAPIGVAELIAVLLQVFSVL
jgi:hypothetical protein